MALDDAQLVEEVQGASHGASPSFPPGVHSAAESTVLEDLSDSSLVFDAAAAESV